MLACCLKCLKFAILIRRSQHLELYSAGLSEAHDEGKKLADGSVDPVKPLTNLINDTRDCKTKNSVEIYSCSSPESVDDFLADSTDVENSSSALESSRNGLIKATELTLTLGNKNGDATNSRAEAQKTLMISEPAHEYNQGEETLIAKLTRSEKQRSDELPLNECKNIESGLPVDNAFRREYQQDWHDQVIAVSSFHIRIKAKSEFD